MMIAALVLTSSSIAIADEVAPPTAADLATYAKKFPGKGPLGVTFATSLGTIHCTLFDDKTPMTVASFVGLATGQKAFTDATARPPRSRSTTA